MKVSLDRLEGGRLVERHRLDATHPVLAGLDARPAEPLTVVLELVNPSAGTYVLDATVSGTLEASCRRCVVPTRIEVEERFRTVYREGDEGGRGETDPDLVTIEPRAALIDVGDELRERLFLELERYPLCRDDCAGLCPQCGIDRNEATCDCTIDRSDPRWSALEAVRLDQD